MKRKYSTKSFNNYEHVQWNHPFNFFFWEIQNYRVNHRQNVAAKQMICYKLSERSTKSYKMFQIFMIFSCVLLLHSNDVASCNNMIWLFCVITRFPHIHIERSTSGWLQFCCRKSDATISFHQPHTNMIWFLEFKVMQKLLVWICNEVEKPSFDVAKSQHVYRHCIHVYCVYTASMCCA